MAQRQDDPNATLALKIADLEKYIGNLHNALKTNWEVSLNLLNDSLELRKKPLPVSLPPQLCTKCSATMMQGSVECKKSDCHIKFPRVLPDLCLQCHPENDRFCEKHKPVPPPEVICSCGTPMNNPLICWEHKCKTEIQRAFPDKCMNCHPPEERYCSQHFQKHMPVIPEKPLPELERCVCGLSIGREDIMCKTPGCLTKFPRKFSDKCLNCYSDQDLFCYKHHPSIVQPQEIFNCFTCGKVSGPYDFQQKCATANCLTLVSRSQKKKCWDCQDVKDLVCDKHKPKLRCPCGNILSGVPEWRKCDVDLCATNVERKDKTKCWCCQVTKTWGENIYCEKHHEKFKQMMDLIDPAKK